MENPKDYLEKNRAAIFDWSVMTISFLLGFIFPTIRDFIIAPGFSNWMLAALLLYVVGTALKHLPLSYRMTYQSRTARPVPYLLFLLIGHWLIFLFVIILSEGAFRHIFNLPPLTGEETAGWPIVLASTVGGAIITWMVYRSKSNRKGRKKYGEKRLFYQEIIADLLLLAGVSILSFVFWEKGAIALLGRASTKTISDIWFIFVFLSILFLFFYLPLRYLYFVEDREGGRNRRRLLYILTFILLRALFEMINF